MPDYGEVSWVRLPTELKEKIQSLAEREHRTLTGQIVTMLEQSVEQHENDQSPAPAASVSPVAVPAAAAKKGGK